MPDDLLDPNVVSYAQLAIYLHDREVQYFDAKPKRSELVLADAGLSIAAIANITGRKYDTVKTTIRRARAADAKDNS